jgi:hypothetical protein
METLYENPWPAVLFGGLIVAILGSGWIQTGKRWLLALMGLAILLTVGAVMLERVVVTDREAVRATLFEIAELVEQNRIDDALAYVHSGSPQVRQQVNGELPAFDFVSVDIKRNLEIEVFPEYDPPEARAEFNVMVVLNSRNGAFGETRVPRFVEVTMYREADGRWTVGGYAHYDPRRGWTIEQP